MIKDTRPTTNTPVECHATGSRSIASGGRNDQTEQVPIAECVPPEDRAEQARCTPFERIDEVRRIFAIVEDSGHRLTEPRSELIRAVSAQGPRPFTGEDLYDELRDTGLGRATVFRTLKLLLDLDVLSRLHMEDGCQQYILAPADGNRGENHHDRLICRICGRVAYLDNCPMENTISEIAQRSGYSVETHHLDIIGLCTNCNEAPINPVLEF